MNNKGGRSATLERWADRVEDVLKPHACGLTHAQVADKAGLSLATTSKALCASAKRGGALFIRTAGAGAIWWHYQHREAAFSRQAAIKSAARARARSKAPELEPDLSAFERPMVHRIVPANEAMRLRPRGPNSVWSIAA